MLRNRILGILHKYPLIFSSAKTGFVLWSADIFTQFIEIKNSQDEQKQDLHRNGRFALIGSILIVSIVNARINCDSTLKLYYSGTINPFSRQVMDKITGTQITNEILSKISSF